MTAALALPYISAICVVGAVFFKTVDWLEPNRWLAVVFKIAILAAGGAAIAITYCPEGCSQSPVLARLISTEFAHH
jgi:hypothetical protein